MLDELRTRHNVKPFSYVLMPEHFHLLLWPSDQANPSPIIQSLRERTAKFTLKNLKDNAHFPWCRRMLARLRLLASDVCASLRKVQPLSCSKSARAQNDLCQRASTAMPPLRSRVALTDQCLVIRYST